MIAIQPHFYAPSASGGFARLVAAARCLVNRWHRGMTRRQVIASLAPADARTGLWTRRQATLLLAARLCLAERSGRPLSLALVAPRHGGSEAGDEALKILVTRLTALCGPDEWIARWDGATLLVVLGDRERETVARRLITAFTERHGSEIPIMGIAQFGRDGRELDDLIAVAAETFDRAWVGEALARGPSVSANVSSPRLMLGSPRPRRAENWV